MVNRFVSWPTDVLRPTTSLQGRLRFASPRRRGNNRCCRRRGSGPNRNGNRSRPESNASCWQPTRKGTGSACWCASHPAQATPRTLMRAWKSCICSTASCGSTSASSSPATTTTLRPERATNSSGARQAAPAFSSPAPRIRFAEVAGARWPVRGPARWSPACRRLESDRKTRDWPFSGLILKAAPQARLRASPTHYCGWSRVFRRPRPIQKLAFDVLGV